ncbi:prolyl-tRNA synthetase [Methanoregula boonei 6A8]|uniref:Proline--tRNA ligase n=1 Tax=Methanoregula boonei (strain DSM 21154 / JCM 14090 / 6A8) TaxID=456442 RepID=SYP_METB6|nr:proline--tRNA ligase [Methanoregula boonei]A7I9R7.1 RecName: Full=Proline--tRNA ligase; AltName: Full=Prolyl-tRNA synthetase; Short=ProRS [Methanoregula boonei 6A8]ABS56478.1 prolyl-tRNA synthetase [Methanoregula boonei 6A8]
METDTGALPKKQDFSEWYNEILWRAEIMDVRYPVKGLYVWFPYGFAIRKFVYQHLRELLDRDHKETLFPLLIPEQEFMKEAEHIKGFEDEVYWVTHGGTTPLEVKLALRPTSETAIYPMFALWVRSHADLPIKIYQIVNTFRYETKQTRPLIRLREITSFMESHTVHATWDEAEIQVESEIALTREFYRNLCIPIIISKRPDWDKFPGADYTIAVDAIMPNGKTLQIGTVHHLGNHFSRTFNIQYEDKNGEQKEAYQTCYGISERCIAALISLHGDDKGLILPPTVATFQVVIVPITIGKRHEDVLAAAGKLKNDLENAGLRVTLDTRDLRPGAKYYWWEIRGVPLRLELGPRDLDSGKAMAVTRTGEKTTICLANAAEDTTSILTGITDAIRAKAGEHTKSHLCTTHTMDGLDIALNEGKVAVVHWCRDRTCGDTIEEKANSSLLGTEVRSEYIEATDGPCIICGKPGKATLVGRTY